MKTYASLHNHTCYSNVKLIDSINTQEGLMDYGYELGLKAIALTEHECLGGHIKALKYYNKKYKDKDFKLILGNEIYITREGLCAETHQTGEKFYHTILLAKDDVGYEQLRILSSRAWERGYVMFMMRTPTYISDLQEIVGANPGHLICTTACIGGFCGVQFLKSSLENKDDITSKNLLFNEEVPKITAYLGIMKDIFGDDFYIELQPSFNEEQIAYNKYMINHYWGQYDFTVATDSHYLKANERSLHKAFLQSKDGEGNREVDEFYSATYMMGADEVERYLQDYIPQDKIDTMFENTLKIAEKCVCNYDSIFHEQIVPRIKYDWGSRDQEAFDSLKAEIESYGDKYQDALRYFSTDDKSDTYLAFLIAEGYYSGKIEGGEEYIARLDNELHHIHQISLKKNQPLSDYFNTMAKIIDIVWSDGDSLVGPGRGSGCGSLINYLIGITQLNPLRQELQMPFWRFMDQSKVELPD